MSEDPAGSSCWGQILGTLGPLKMPLLASSCELLRCATSRGHGPLAMSRAPPDAHRIRTWNRRDSSALGETSLFVSASVTVVEPSPLARKTSTTHEPTRASET